MIQSPCMRHCGVIDGVCHGCGRTIREIRIWSKCDDKEKQKIVTESSLRLKRVQALRDEGVSDDREK